MTSRRKLVAFAAFVFLVAGCASTSRIKPPKLVEKAELIYPLEAKLQHIQGDVLVGMSVGVDGTVQDVQVLRSSGFPILDEAAIDYASKLRFRPATIDDRPVASHTQMLLKFRLRRGEVFPANWVENVRSLQNELRKARGERRRKLLQQLLESYIAFARYAEKQPDPSLGYKVKLVVSPAVRERWKWFWGRDPASFAVLDDFLQRTDEPGLVSIAENELYSLLLEATQRVRARLSRQRDPDERDRQMLASLETYLDQHFQQFRRQP